ncbi:MAG: hypothetical protein F6K55_14195 [Moorea sp. SIO4A3]|nr:hypothetical protein [Moorena sp. SIO4A3]
MKTWNIGFHPEKKLNSLSYLWMGKIPAATLEIELFFVLFRRGGASRVVNKAYRSRSVAYGLATVRAAEAKADTVGWCW